MTHTNGTADVPTASWRGTPRTGPRRARTLTTAEVARLAGVSRRTIQSWADRGILPCHRLPDPAGRRFEPAAVARLLRARGRHTPADLDAAPVLVVGGPPLDGEPCRLADTAFDAGVQFEANWPATVVVHVAGVGRAAALGIVECLGRQRVRPEVVIVVPTEDDSAAPAFVKLGCRVVPPGGEG
jgi:excisionase family DNA binding protein